MSWFKDRRRHILAGKGISTGRKGYGKKDASKKGAKEGGLRRNKTDNCRHPKTPLKGGLAEGKNPKDYDKKQLKRGIEIEKEHTDDEEIAQRIAMDHLEEHPDYYKELPKMEKKLERREKRQEKKAKRIAEKEKRKRR